MSPKHILRAESRLFPGGGDGQTRRYLWSCKGVRGLPRSITQKAQPRTSWVSKTKKQTPFLGGMASDSTAEPTKGKQGT